ncbi:MAG: tyrosine-protein phosphatase [Oligoflexia bacterium]|nr:tyrosine-protein phosphatase [Oligoflexia bacterium]
MEQVLKQNNMGASIVKFASGNKTVYRSSFLSGSESCISDLVKDGGVKTIVNLYGGEIENQNALAIKERGLLQKSGGDLYVNILNYDYKFSKNPKETIFKKIKIIIKQIEMSEGNVLIHCYGGVHRTGIVYGVIQKCINKLPIETVIQEYKCHTAYENSEKVGGYESENEVVIREFPCDGL